MSGQSGLVCLVSLGWYVWSVWVSMSGQSGLVCMSGQSGLVCLVSLG